MNIRTIKTISRILSLVLCVFVVIQGMAQNCHIEGRVAMPALQGKNIAVINMNTGKPLASTKITDSMYVFDIEVEEPFVGYLKTDPQNGNPNSYYFLRIIGEPGNIYADLLTDSLSGTPLNDRLNQFSGHCNYEVSVLNAYFSKMRQNVSMTDEERNRQMQEMDVRLASLRSFVKDMYKENKTNALGAIALENYLEYDDSVSYEALMLMLEGAAPVVTTYQPLVQKLVKLEKMSHTAVGKPFIDLDLTDYKTGKPVKLSKVINGKVALIDFWASWCRPCRAEIPHIAKIHEKFGGKDFVVISLNVWDKPAAQAKAIKDLDMTWTQLTDATQNATDTYGVDGIPQILLIGKDGKILARDLRGERIEQAVRKALGK